MANSVNLKGQSDLSSKLFANAFLSETLIHYLSTFTMIRTKAMRLTKICLNSKVVLISSGLNSKILQFTVY